MNFLQILRFFCESCIITIVFRWNLSQWITLKNVRLHNSIHLHELIDFIVNYYTKKITFYCVYIQYNNILYMNFPKMPSYTRGLAYITVNC